MEYQSDKTVFIIAGPTAVGKTAIAIDLAKKLSTAIVSADSRQCYREMSIGTAKPTAEELQQVEHYFIDEFPVTRHITAADYEQLALNYLDGIFAHSDTAIVCGGTGLYIKALTEGLDDMPAIDPSVEESVNSQYDEKGMSWLQAETEQQDPEFFRTGEIQNPARLLRALIFKLSTGSSITSFRKGKQKQRPFRIIKVALELPRDILYERINHRVDVMMKNRLLEEVKSLEPYKHLKNLQTVGYSELFEYLNGRCTLDEAVDKIKQHTRNYAKRQLTWFRKDKEYKWLDAGDNRITGRILSYNKRAL